MSALIGALRVSLSAETAQFEAGMKRAQRTADKTNSAFKKSFGGLGGIVKAGFAGVVSGISIGLITQGVKAALDYAGSLAEVSQQLGVTTKDLQVFRYAAGQVGISQEQMEKGLQKLTITLGQLAAGAKAPRSALEGIRKGLADQVLQAKDTGEAFRLIADGLSQIPNRAERAAAEVALFGRAGAQLDNLLAGGSGAINELSAAAEKLGIVLSDEQIQKADDTADKLEALKTVLAARVAGVVADNADSIMQLADALAAIVGVAAQAAGALARFFSVASQPLVAGKSLFGTLFGLATNPAGTIAQIGMGLTNPPKGGQSTATIALPEARKSAPKLGTGSIGKFLAPSGGGGRSKRDKADDAERKRQEALRAAYRFDQELLRAQQDVLRAQQQLSTDYSERAALSIQMLNLEQQGFQREMEYAVASGDLTKAQAAQLEAEFAKTDALERQAVLAEEEANRKEDYNRLDQLDFDLQLDILESQEQLARTASESRAIRLRILDLEYRAEKARLDAVIADEQSSWAAKEEARRRLAALDKMKGNDEQAARNGTQDPLEAYFSRIPKTADEMNEALNGVVANGLQNLEDGLVGILTGTEKVGDAFKKMAQEIIAQLIRIQVQQFILKVAQGLGVPQAMPGGVPATPPGFATGGGFTIMGRQGVDKNLLSLNGLPIARVSHGERVNISNDNGGRGGGGSITNHFSISGPVSRQTELQISSAVRRGVAQANRKGA